MRYIILYNPFTFQLLLASCGAGPALLEKFPDDVFDFFWRDFMSILSNIFLNSSKVNFPSPSESSWNNYSCRISLISFGEKERSLYRWLKTLNTFFIRASSSVAESLLLKFFISLLVMYPLLSLSRALKANSALVVISVFIKYHCRNYRNTGMYLCYNSILVFVKGFHEEIWTLENLYKFVLL